MPVFCEERDLPSLIALHSAALCELPVCPQVVLREEDAAELEPDHGLLS